MKNVAKKQGVMIYQKERKVVNNRAHKLITSM